VLSSFFNPFLHPGYNNFLGPLTSAGTSSSPSHFRNLHVHVLSVKTHRGAVTRQHEEPGGSRDYWWAPVPRSTAQDPAHDLASGLLGVPPDLVPDQEGVEVVSVSFLHA
jgi:hypothetical protein